jgi:hypothetical protein
MGLLDRLKHVLAIKPSARRGEDRPKRRQASSAGSVKDKDIADLPPERAAELAGHAPERVET